MCAFVFEFVYVFGYVFAYKVEHVFVICMCARIGI